MSDDPMSSLPSTSAGPSRTLPINLFTHNSPDSIPPSTYLLPANWRRFQLSELINKVLTTAAGTEDEREPVPFEFVIDGEVLRGSLEGWVKKYRQGDEERVVDVEYRRTLGVPKEVGRREVEDWVSGLSLARPGYILLSSYLSHLQLIPLSSFSSPSTPLTLPLPSLLGATCCTYLSPPRQETDILIAAGGVDRQTHIFQIPSLSPESTSTPREVYTLYGHTGPISSVISGRGGKDVITASWDGSVNLYVLPETEPTDEEGGHQIESNPTSFLPGQKKRRKVMGKGQSTVEGLNDGDVGEGGWRRVPDTTFRGHKGRVGGLVWDKKDQERVWSVGWDGAVRGWELEMGREGVVRQGPTDKSMLCIDQFAATGTLATGAMDRTICLWDTREATSLISLTIPTPSPVPSLTCHPTSQFTLAAATYSGQIQIWDIRSPKHAIFSVSKASSSATGGQGKKREVTKNGKVLGERLLAIDWDGERLVAGGEDGEVGLWDARGE